MRVKSMARVVVALLLAIPAFSAQATFHLIKVVEVFPGTPAAPSAQYVVIQMYAAGQEFVGTHAITVFNGSGALVGTFTFPGSVPNGSNQAKILIATTQAQSFFGVTADLTMSAALISAGGKVCWAGTLDCVAWGAYTGSSAGVGTPFNASGGGLLPGRAAIRRLDIAGSATILDALDDTDTCSNDFVSGLPAPRNNAGMLGKVPAASCGNGVLEGLEQCDDHNLVNGDGCSSTCTVTPVVVKHAIGDYNGDGKSDVFWRNASTGGNVIWKSANSATPQAVTSLSPGDWRVAGRGDFDGDGKADVLWRNESTGSNVIWKSGNSATPQAVTGVTNDDWKVVGVGDFSGDGKADVFWRNASTGANTIWKSGNSATPQATASVTNLGWQVVGIGDFNGDGTADVLWRDTGTGANAIWKSGNKATPQAVTGVTSQDWKIVATGDFDGDGKSDVFWRNTSTGADTIWKSANSATQQATSAVTSQAWKVVGTGDFDGDGKSDVFWRNTSSGANAIWRSGNLATSQAVSGVTNLAWNVVPYEGQALVATPILTIADVAVAEGNAGNTPATFTVRLSQPSASPVTYAIATANATATAGSDYVANSQGAQTIAAGATSKAFVVSIIGDVAAEPSETFNVNVSNVTGALVGDGQARGTIVNDDSPLLTIADVSVTEGNNLTRLATFTVQLSKPSSSAVSYNIATANGTASAGSDYVARGLAGEAIPAGSTSRVFAVTINGDTMYEGDETFNVNVTNVVGATVSDGQAWGTIVNDDTPYGY